MLATALVDTVCPVAMMVITEKGVRRVGETEFVKQYTP